MIKSGTTFLYCGVDIIKKKHSNVPYMIDTIDWLILDAENLGLLKFSDIPESVKNVLDLTKTFY